MTDPAFVLDDAGVRRVALAPIRLRGGREHEFRGAWQLSTDGWLVVERAVCPACCEPFRAGEHATLAPRHFACRFGVDPAEMAPDGGAEQ